jgi:methionyl aminopeptidase
MILIKSKREIELMRAAGQIVAACHKMLSTHIKPGINTYQLDELAENFIKSQGGVPTFKGYHGFKHATCMSVNECVVHGIPSKSKVLKEGDIISIDIGVTYKGYIADSAWTYPVGQISDELRQLLKVTEESLFIGLEAAKAGNYVGDIGHAIEEFIVPYGYGIVEDFTGHGVGASLHEDPQIPNFGAPQT